MDKPNLIQILKKEQIAVLSTSDSDGNPHGSTIFFIHDNDLNFLFFFFFNTRKYENITANKRGALTVIFSNQQKTVQAEGIIKEVPRGAEEYHNAILQMSEKNAKQGGISWPPPLSKMPEADIVIYKMVVDWLRYSDYSKLDTEVHSQIIPSSLDTSK